MTEIIHAGFESATLSFIRDLTIDELIDVIVEHVASFDEAMEAADVLDSTWTAGSYSGTGWRIWFARRNQTGTIH